MNSGQEQSERTKAEQSPSLNELRGPNSTLKLAGLLEASLKFSGNERAFAGSPEPTIIQNAVTELNRKWIRPIDQEVTITATVIPPKSRAELEQQAQGLIDRRKIQPEIHLIEVLSYHSEKRFLARQDQWHLVQALFGIDTSLLTPGSAGGQSLKEVAQLERVHEVMLGLIEKAVRSRGGNFEIDHDERGKYDRPVTGFRASSLLDGVTVRMGVQNIGSNIVNAKGYPNITGVYLELSPSFLVSARPLEGEDFSKYFQKKEGHQSGRQSQEESRQEGRRYQGEESRGQYEQRERTGDFRRRTETGVDPRDPQGYYKTLGVNPDADSEDMEDVLKAAYRRLSHKYHSDTGGANASDEKMSAINKAFEFLSKEANRRNYGRRN